MMVLLVSCGKPTPPPERVWTENEREHYKGLDLESKVKMDDCLAWRYGDNMRSYASCIEITSPRYRSRGKSRDSGSSIIDTAVGTAIGVGAAKMILGK